MDRVSGPAILMHDRAPPLLDGLVVGVPPGAALPVRTCARHLATLGARWGPGDPGAPLPGAAGELLVRGAGVEVACRVRWGTPAGEAGAQAVCGLMAAHGGEGGPRRLGLEAASVAAGIAASAGVLAAVLSGWRGRPVREVDTSVLRAARLFLVCGRPGPPDAAEPALGYEALIGALGRAGGVPPPWRLRRLPVAAGSRIRRRPARGLPLEGVRVADAGSAGEEGIAVELLRMLGAEVESGGAASADVVLRSDGGAGEEAVQARTACAHGLVPLGEAPAPTRVPLLRTLRDLLACEGVLAALCLQARVGGRWQVETSLSAAAMALQEHVVRAIVLGRERGRRMGRPVWGMLDRPLETANGWIVVEAGDEDARCRLALACGAPAGAEEAVVVARLRERTAEAWVERLAAAGVPAAVVREEGAGAVLAAPWTFSRTQQ